MPSTPATICSTCAEIGEVGGDELLIRGQIVRLADVAPADARIDALEQLAQARADAAGRSGDEDFFHLSLLSISAAILRRRRCKIPLSAATISCIAPEAGRLS